MSFLTLFTTDALMHAHGHEFSSPPAMKQAAHSLPQRHQSVSRISSPPPPTVLEEAIHIDHPRERPSKPHNSKTKYTLAQPPPGAHRHIPRERSLVVQVQKLSNNSRPLPIYDAVPALALQSRLKKVGHCLKHGLGMHDIALVTSEEYEGSDGDDSEDEMSRRRIRATISQVQRKGTHVEDGKQRMTLFELEDGTQWEANPLASGGYEFVSMDRDGFMRVAKWLPKANIPRRRSYQPGQRASNDLEGRKFQFSVLDKVNRRRPILAWMVQRNLDILDRHPGTLAAADSPLQSPSVSTDELGSPLSRPSTPEETEFTYLPESLRILIIATGIWVSQREGLTGVYRTGEELTTTPSTASFRHSLNGRPTSLQVPASPMTPTSEKLSAFDDSASKRIHRRGTMLAHNATTQKAPHHESNEDVVLPKRARSVSNGASKFVNFNRLSKGPLPTPPSSRPSTPPAPAARSNTPAPEQASAPLRYRPRKSYSAPNTPQRHELSAERGQLPMRALEDYDRPERGRRHSRFRLRAMVSSIFKKSPAAA